MSLNPLHVCGTRIWLNFTLKSSIIESSVMRCFFFFPHLEFFHSVTKHFTGENYRPWMVQLRGKPLKSLAVSVIQ